MPIYFFFLYIQLTAFFSQFVCQIVVTDAELDRMWNEGTLNEERIESFRHLHERTPYNKPKYTFNK